MARLADYFVVVGYDQEKAGKSDGASAPKINCNAVVCVREAVSGMMLMLDSAAI